jgi:hypothetical protein
MFSVGVYWEFPMESHALVGTGVPISLGTPVRHPSSKVRKYAHSSKSFRRCCIPVPPTRKVWRPNSASNRNVAPQFREQDESGTPVPLRAKIWHLSSSNKEKWHPSSTQSNNLAPQFREQDKTWHPSSTNSKSLGTQF